MFNNINYDLYEQAKNNQKFTKLFNRIISDENILLAYQNIKNNINKFIINADDITQYTKEELIQLIRQKIIYLKPNVIQKTIIQKFNNECVPISLCTIYDKIIQQCFKQVLEPICEAYFSPHSYGYRPGRTVENAIAEVYQKINVNDLYYVVEINIKNLYENINHSKLIKQLWTLGIQDTKVIYRIKQILKSSLQINKKLVQLNKGIYQSGILMSLLANIVLNEFDQWIESQWNKFNTNHKYTNHGNKIRALKKTKLKEIYIIRYMDNIRIFCRTLDQAKRIKIASIQWLQERLELEINEEKTQVINLNHKWNNFLGFKYKILYKNKNKVIYTEVADVNLRYIIQKLKKQLKQIQHSTGFLQKKMIEKYNYLVESIHCYYEIATCVCISFHKINNIINNIINNRLQVTKNGKCTSLRYKNSKQIRYLSGLPLYPIGYVKFRMPLVKKFNSEYKVNN